MILSSEEAEKIIGCNHTDWERFYCSITDQSRWSTYYEAVFKNRKDNKFYMFNYEQGSTEMQECDPFYDDEVEPVEVEKTEVLVTKFVPIKDLSSPVEHKE
jgi:hypothetical protein